MPLGKLHPMSEEEVTWLERVQSEPDELGQREEYWASADIVHGRVLPLGTEEAVKAGLMTDRNRVQVRLPLRDTSLQERVRLRDYDWEIVRMERWPSHLLLVLEEV